MEGMHVTYKYKTYKWKKLNVASWSYQKWNSVNRRSTPKIFLRQNAIFAVFVVFAVFTNFCNYCNYNNFRNYFNNCNFAIIAIFAIHNFYNFCKFLCYVATVNSDPPLPPNQCYISRFFIFAAKTCIQH